MFIFHFSHVVYIKYIDQGLLFWLDNSLQNKLFIWNGLMTLYSIFIPRLEVCEKSYSFIILFLPNVGTCIMSIVVIQDADILLSIHLCFKLKHYFLEDMVCFWVNNLLFVFH